VPGTPLPDPDTPAPPRFLPAFDNALLSHADRARVVSDEHRKALSKDPFMRGVLLDGFACGTWKTERTSEMERTSGRTDLVIEPFGPLNEQDRAALAEEGGRLLVFAEPGADVGEVRFVESG
jgi:hypothetical protein